MSVEIDSVNRWVRLNGGIGDTQGAYYTFNSPLAGVIGIRVAYRIYFDTFPAGSVSPYTTATSGNHRAFYYSSGTSWEGSTCVGLCFNTTFPTFKSTDAHGFEDDASKFIGARTGGYGANATLQVVGWNRSTDSSVLLGNVGAVMCMGGVNTGVDYTTYRTLWAKPTKVGSTTAGVAVAVDSFGSLAYATDKLAGVLNIPADPTEGAKWTVGIDIRKGVDFTVAQTTYYNTDSLSEADLLNVFTDYDDFRSAITVSRSTTTRDTDDAFYPVDNTFVPPPYFMFRWGGPSQRLVVSAFRYQYLYS